MYSPSQHLFLGSSSWSTLQTRYDRTSISGPLSFLWIELVVNGYLGLLVINRFVKLTSAAWRSKVYQFASTLLYFDLVSEGCTMVINKTYHFWRKKIDSAYPSGSARQTAMRTGPPATPTSKKTYWTRTLRERRQWIKFLRLGYHLNLERLNSMARTGNNISKGSTPSRE